MAGSERAVLFQQIDRLYRGGSAVGQDDAQLLARFVRDRDEGAFEALVQRHGPLVLGLCRRFLRDPRDIEDAFQATFMVLARRAGSIRNGSSLSSWLYGVAHKVASRCRSDVLRRRSVETTVDVIEFPVDGASCLADELGPVLDQELDRLPEKYRAPIVLCYLREQTHDQAAAELKWPVGTVRSRLARGRELLRGRLSRRGWAPADAALGLAPLLTPRSFNAPVPPALVEATVASAGRFLGGTAAGLMPAAATITSNLTGLAPTLARGVLSTMAMTQYTWIGSGLAAMALVAGGTGAGAWALSARGDGGPDDRPAAAASVSEAAKPAAASTATAASAGEKGVSARLDRLEQTLKQLLGRLEQLPPLDAAGRLASTAPASPPILAPSPGVQAASAASSTPAPAAVTQPVPTPEAIPASVARAEPAHAPISPTPGPAIATTSALEPTTLPMPATEPEPDLSPDGPRPAVAEVHDDLAPLTRSADGPAPAGRAVSPRFRERRATLEDDNLAAFPRSETPRRQAESLDPFAAPPMSLHEIQARIQIAKRKLERTRSLLKAAAISQSEAQEPIDELLLLRARLQGMQDDATDLTNQGSTNLARLKAELDRARAQLAVSKSVVARNERLNKSKPGMVSPENAARAESEALVAAADLGVKEAEIEGAAVKLKQLDGRHQRLQRLIDELAAAVPELRESSR